MKLTPITTTTEPSYPTYRPTWLRLAAAVAVSASLWLPACGLVEDCSPRLAGEPPMPAQVARPSTDPTPPQDAVKPPEPPVLPDPEPVRTAGVVAPVTPPPQPPQPPPVRFAGQARSPEPPKSFAD